MSQIKALLNTLRIFIDIMELRSKTEYSLDAEHAVITDKHGTGCHEFVSPYINNCGYDGAFEALSHIVDQPI